MLYKIYMNFVIKKYTDEQQTKWDDFVLYKSINGTFLQSRRFISYHPRDKFADHSLMIYKGEMIVACVLACEGEENGGRIFYSHKGTSYGGIIVSKQIYNATSISVLMDLLEKYFIENGFDRIFFKMVPRMLARDNVELLDYFLYQRGYWQYAELNYYLDLKKYTGDISSQFSAGKRRDYRYSLKYDLSFRLLEREEEVKDFYNVLQMNLRKLGLKSVHTYEELLDLKFNRFNEEIEFYGVYLGKRLIAASMVFYFNGHILHTQYLSSDEKYLKYFSMDFLIYNLIAVALKNGCDFLTFGISTEHHGKYLNMGLLRFKEGFGAEYFINRSFEKKLAIDEDYKAEYMVLP